MNASSAEDIPHPAEMIDTRAVIQGASGAGKTYAIRRILDGPHRRQLVLVRWRRWGCAPVPALRPASARAPRPPQADAALRRPLSPALARLDPPANRAGDGPHITVPLDRSQLLMASDTRIKLAVTDGLMRPHRWIVDGEVVDSRPFVSEASWQPRLPCFSKIFLWSMRKGARESSPSASSRATRPSDLPHGYG